MRTVHWMLHGAALCGYGEGRPPNEWPENQVWLPLSSAERFEPVDNERVACIFCQRKLAAQPAKAEKSTDTKRFAVYAIRETKQGNVWVRAGVAFQNRDGTISVDLDVLPIGGKLTLKDPPPEPA